MKRSLAILLILTLALSTLLSGCGNPATEEVPVKDTLTIGYVQEPATLDWALSSNNMVEKMCANIYATMVKFDDNYKVVPYVAESWEISPDGLSYTFKLRDDVYFHDGKKMTAQDVAYTLKRAKEFPASSYYIESVNEITAIDDLTVQLTLLKPYPALMNMLCEAAMGIVNEETVTAMGDQFALTPVGSGPYKVIEWVPGEKIVYEAFDKFFLGEPPIKNVIAKFIPDPSTRLIALENGEIDLTDDMATNNFQAVEQNESLAFSKTPSSKYWYMGFNNQNDIFKNQKFRQAINTAINKEAVIQIAFDGTAVPAACTIAEVANGYPKNITGYTYDVEKAKQLLAESGVSVTTFELMVKDATAKKIAEAIQADLNAIGITANINMVESGGYYDAIAKGSHQAWIGSWADSLMDADAVVGFRYLSSMAGDPGNYDWIKDDKLDNLITTGRQESDPAKRQAIYDELFQYVSDQAFETPLLYGQQTVSYNKDLKGVKAITTAIQYYNNWSW